MNKKTKIVATISDKIASSEMLTKLFDAGVNVIRINTAHQDIETAKSIIKKIRKINSSIAILIDTKGPEVRTSSFGEPFSVKQGELIKIIGNPDGKSGNGTLYVNYKQFVRDISKGDIILIDDGDISMKVVEKNKNELICKIQNSGQIKLRKGVNVPNVKLNLPVLSEKDKQFIDFAIENQLDFIAHSFVQHAKDILEIRKILHSKNSKIQIIAKIENQIGIDNIDEIIKESDGIMIARGDLGIEIAAEKIPVIQRELTCKCIRENKAVIVATQMLHSMIQNPRATRAEVNDVATAVYEGADALMLSGETASGKYPVESVNLMSRIIKEVEATLEKSTIEQHPFHSDILSILSHSAVLACDTLPIKAIIVDTQSGRTARFLSAYRGKVPVYAFCYNDYAMRQLALTFGVTAYLIKEDNSRDDFLKNVIEFLSERNVLKLKDTVVIIGGSFGMAHGASFMEISTVKNLKYYLDEKYNG